VPFYGFIFHCYDPMRKNLKIYIKAYVFLAPSAAIISIVFIYPLIQTFVLSLHRVGGRVSQFVGFFNYKFLLLRDEGFQQAIINNLTLLISIPILVALSILIAVLLYERIRGWRSYQVMVFVPYVIPITVIGIVFGRILRWDGILNYILDFGGMDFLMRDWLGNSKIAIFSIMEIIIWRNLGFGVVLLLARVISIQEEIFEAARIDGANWLQNLIYITIPQLKIILLYFITLMIITMFSWVFNYIYVITQGGPGHSTMVLELVIYRYGIPKFMPGMASAAASLLFGGIVVFIFLLLGFRKEIQAGGQ
jgi:ABC-type sugar transport system permease subunit